MWDICVMGDAGVSDAFSYTKVPLGRLTEIEDPRTVWPHEAHNFTPWLAANADVLASALGIDIELTSTEHPVGGFSLDLIGNDVTHGKKLIVENQLTPSDHGHLGQLLTYAAGTDAATIVWIALAFRDEHRQALDWLNAQTGPDIHFFAVELHVVQIGDSTPAPLLDVVVSPNDWQKTVKAAAAADSGKASLYRAFWAKFLDRLTSSRPAWSKAKDGTFNSWFPMSVGLPKHCRITASFTGDGRLRSEFYVDYPTQEQCKQVFDSLHSDRVAFEAAYGRELDWQRLDDRKACRIADHIDGTVEQTEQHDQYLGWFIDAGDRMRKALVGSSFETDATDTRAVTGAG